MNEISQSQGWTVPAPTRGQKTIARIRPSDCGSADLSAFLPGARAPLGLLLLAGVVGILLDKAGSFPLVCWWGAATGSVALWTILLLRGARYSVHFGTVLVCCAAVAVLGGWHHAYWNLYPQNHLIRCAADHPEPVCCQAIVLETPKVLPPVNDPLQPFRDEVCTKARIAVTGIRAPLTDRHSSEYPTVERQIEVSSRVPESAPDAQRHRWLPVSGRAIMYVNGPAEHLRAGDNVQIFGRLSLLGGLRNPGGYSAIDRGRSERTLCRVSVSFSDAVTITKRRSSWDARWWLERLHQHCRASLFRYLDDDSAALASAVLLGDREYLDASQVESFFVTGSVHLLAISGLHLAIVVQALFVVARALTISRRKSLYLIMVFSVLYAALTGGRPPVIRAAVLVWMLCLELLYFRPRFSFNSLAAAGLIILAINPTSLFNAGVQLSFLAVATLVWLSRLDRVRELAGLRTGMQFQLEDATLWPYLWGKLRQRIVQTALAGFAIWFVSIPLVMHRFHLVPVSGLVLNLFLLLPLAAALYCGLLVILFAWLPPLASCFAFGCERSLAFITACVGWAEGFELAHGWVAGPAFAATCLFYAILIVFGAFRRFSLRWPIWFGGAFAALLVGCVLASPRGRRSQADVECAFLSVGHGVCIVMQLPDDEIWLYDAGSMGATQSALREVSAFLWSKGITQLDGILLSHGDVDHFNVVPQLVERFRVKQVCTSPATFESVDAAIGVLQKRLDERRVPVRFVGSGAKLCGSRWGSVTVRHPDPDQLSNGDNANSLVVEVAYFGRRILLTGDLEGEGLSQLLSSDPIDCDIVMAPHHGSKHSRPADFAVWCQPEWVVVSGGDPERSREAEAAYRAAGAKVLHTAHEGAVTAVLTPDRVMVSSL